jgi:tetratricopeptide (TPR) repeat protein
MNMAIQSFNEGINEDNQKLDLYVNRAMAYEKKGKIDLAIQEYEYVLSINPSHAIAAHNLLNLQKTKVSDQHQLESLNAFIDENPAFAQGYVSRGLFYYDQMDFNLAKNDFEQALEIQPDNIDYLFNLALCEEKLKNTSHAIDLFLKVTSLEPGHSGAYFNLGNIQFKQNIFEEAISYYTIAHNLNPKNIIILYNRGLAYHESGQDELACQDMVEVRKVNNTLADSFFTKYCKTAK